MLRTNTTFDTYNAANQKKPCLVIEIAGMGIYYATQAFSGMTSSYKKWLVSGQIISENVELLAFENGNFGIDFDVIDPSDTLYSFIVNNNLIGKTVTGKIGFAEIAIANFITLPICYVQSWEILDDKITYRIRARDIKQREFERKLFRAIPVCELTADYSGGGGTLTTTSTAAFTAATSALWGNSNKTYLKIDNEILEYTTKNANSFVATGGQFGTAVVNHYDGATIKEVVVINDNPFDFLVQLMANDNGGMALPEWFGLDFNKTNDVDEMQIQSEKRKWDYPSDAWEYYWIIDEEKAAKEFIREQVLKLLPGFLFYTETGKIGLKVWDFRAIGEALAYQTAWNKESFDAKTFSDDRNLLTELYYHYSYDAGKKLTQAMTEYTVAELTTRFGRRKSLDVTPEIYPNIGTDQLTSMLRRYFRNSFHGHVYWNAKTFIKRWISQVGDLAPITDAYLKDFSGGTGWEDETVMLTKMNIKVSKDESNCEFEGINYTGLPVAAGATFSYELANESSINDAAVAYGTPGSDVTGAEDAYYDTATLTEANEVHFVIEADLPAGSNAEQYAEFEFRGGDSVGPTYDMQSKRLYYNSSWTGKIVREFVLYVTTPALSVNRVKVDYVGRSTSGADELTNIKLKQVKLIRDNYTIS